MPGGGGQWDVAEWNDFVWSAGAAEQPHYKLEISGRNIGFYFYQNRSDELPHTIHGVHLQLSYRRLVRG